MHVLNSPDVVHETMDGETILLHLKTGNYYSFDRFGAIVWQTLMVKGTVIDLEEKFELNEEQTYEITNFISSLLDEELIKEGTTTGEEDEELLASLISGFKRYTTPMLRKYSDMQELLLLDPIHDVDDNAGWPEVGK